MSDYRNFAFFGDNPGETIKFLGRIHPAGFHYQKGGSMAERTIPKKRKIKSRDKEGRVTLRIRNELIQELETMADGEELSLSAFIRQLLKHEVVAKKTRDREFEQFRESQRRLHVPKSEGSRRMLVG